MKYILIASLLASAVYSAPSPIRGQGGRGRLAAAIAAGQQRQGQQGAAQGVTQGNNRGGAASGGAQNQPIGQDTGLGAPLQPGQTPTAGDLATAVSNWMADTSMVSNFLDIGKSITDDAQFRQAALVAFNAEVDELDHKAIIDAANGNQPNVIAANSTLAGGGAFQDVVDKLKIMADQGTAAVNNIDLILQNRCVNVLPNIDAYMASTGSSSQAVRPKVCDQTGIVGGVQGNGPTLPGQAPGTPAAAFAAAKALASGQGNGLVQNGGAQNGGGRTGGGRNGGAGGQGTNAAGQQKGRLGQGQAGAGAGNAAAGAGTSAGKLGRLGQGQAGAGTGAGANAGAGAGFLSRLGQNKQAQGAGAATGAGVGAGGRARLGQKPAGAAGAAAGGAAGGLARLGQKKPAAPAGAAAGGAAGAGGALRRLGQAKPAVPAGRLGVGRN